MVVGREGLWWGEGGEEKVGEMEMERERGGGGRDGG